MSNGLAGEKRPDDLYTFKKACVALLLFGPWQTSDTFVDRLAAAERQPKATRVHLRQRCSALSYYGGGVKINRSREDAERERGAFRSGPEPRTGEDRLAVAL